MPPPKPPSRVESVTFPMFGMHWFADLYSNEGRNIVAYCGGGGSARTGVNNSILVQDSSAEDDIVIPTGNDVGVAIVVYQNPTSRRLWILVSFGKNVHRYDLEQRQVNGTITVNNQEAAEQKADPCNALAVNAQSDRIALGCESGLIEVYATSDDRISMLLFSCQGHTKTVCSLSFSIRQERLVSAAKDGTARVWNNEGHCLSEMTCVCEPPPANRAPPQILVRGCAFADLNGQVALTVASAKRGKAFLSQWQQQDTTGNYRCVVRTVCSQRPIGAMSLAQDGDLLALGGADGSVYLWSVNDWKQLRAFPEVHGLPIMCIAVRPLPVRLQGDDDVKIHARSASADNQVACLTLQRRGPKAENAKGSGIFVFVHRLLQVAFVAWVVSPVFRDAYDKCAPVWSRTQDHNAVRRCIVDEVVIAPSSRPGIATPPY